jgi:capsular polysaccharide transport system permease protein
MNDRDTALQIQLRVIGAIVLRDMRTRFGRTYLGYVVAVLWPLSHLLTLMIAYAVTRKIAPVGTDTNTFFATGVLPYILCLYPARFIMLSVEHNRPLLSFPIVKSIDLIIGRVVVEVMTAFYVLILFLAILSICDVDIVPLNIEEAVMAVLAAIYLSIGIGIFSAVMFALTRAWLVVFVCFVIVIYTSSGAIFMPSNLPSYVVDILWFNPLLHCVEWLRSAYYESYADDMLSRSYLLQYATLAIVLGLAAERAFRGRISYK